MGIIIIGANKMRNVLLDAYSVSFSVCSYTRRMVWALLYIILTCIYACKNPAPPDDLTNSHPNDSTDYRLYAYQNSGSELYIIDPNTFSLINTLSIPVPDSIRLHGVTLSTDKEYLIFSGIQASPPLLIIL